MILNFPVAFPIPNPHPALFSLQGSPDLFPSTYHICISSFLYLLTFARAYLPTGMSATGDQGPLLSETPFLILPHHYLKTGSGTEKDPSEYLPTCGLIENKNECESGQVAGVLSVEMQRQTRGIAPH